MECLIHASLPLARAKARFSEVPDDVERGHEVVITRRGRAVAHRARAREACACRRAAWVDELRAFVAAQPQGTDTSVVDMRSADRC